MNRPLVPVCVDERRAWGKKGGWYRTDGRKKKENNQKHTQRTSGEGVDCFVTLPE